MDQAGGVSQVPGRQGPAPSEVSPRWEPGVPEQMDLYRRMAVIRCFDEAVLELRHSGEIDGVVHPYIGQEAVAVGTCAQLRTSDGLTSTHRGHGHCLAKGADPDRMMAELFGRRDGYCGGKGGSMHIADFAIGMLGANGIVAAGLPIAAGAALAHSINDDDGLAVCMFGDGAVGAGPFHETLNMASLWQLPLILVCENNGWAVGSPPESVLAASSIASLAGGYRMAAEQVDGNDVLDVGSAVRRAVARARSGGGPTLIEAVTFRISGHAYRGTAVPEGRDPALIEEWRQRDPLLVLGARLQQHGVDQVRLDAVRAGACAEIERAVEFARASSYPDLADALTDVFGS